MGRGAEGNKARKCVVLAAEFTTTQYSQPLRADVPLSLGSAPSPVARGPLAIERGFAAGERTCDCDYVTDS